MARIGSRIATIASLPLAQLRSEWTVLFDAPAPNLPEGLLRMALAYGMQERAIGGVPATITKALKRYGAGEGGDASPQMPSLHPGTRLVRSWNGRTIEVLVTEDGFLFEDRRYRSLSSIARHITGTAWSGPRFFGIAAHG